MTKAWIVRETGDVRVPSDGEYYWGEQLQAIVRCMGIIDDPRPILSVTPLPTREELRIPFEKWYNSVDLPLLHEAWLACYDYLTGPKEETKPVGEMTKQERMRWIYGK